MKSKQSTLTRILFIVYMLLLTGVIIFKLPFYSPEFSDGVRVINLIPFQGSNGENGALRLWEIAYNIIFFGPLGVYISMLRNDWSFLKKALFVIGLSFAFESIQFIFAMGRSDITDILNNTLGGIIGIASYMLLLKILGDKTGKILNGAALIATVIALLRFAHLFYLSHFSMMPPSL